MKQTVGEVYKKSVDYLMKKGIARPEISAQFLLSDVLQIPRLKIFLDFERGMTEKELQKMREYLSRRAKHEPVQYITGYTEFYHTRLKVNSRVLIPRPETEILVDKAMEILQNWTEKQPEKVWKVADLGCGCGNIAIALAKKWREKVFVTAIDVSPEAVFLAKENASSSGTDPWIDFQISTFSEYLAGKPEIDMLLSNPPYVDPSEEDSLPKDVRDYEPHAALFGTEKGFDYPLEILEKSAYLMKGTFALLLEIGWDQHALLEKKCRQLNINAFDFIEDYNHWKRILRIIFRGQNG